VREIGWSVREQHFHHSVASTQLRSTHVASTQQGGAMNKVMRAAPFPVLMAAVLMALLGLTMAPPAAYADAGRGQINIKYEPSWDATDAPAVQLVTQIQMLERMQRFLGPLRLPQDLTIRAASCNGSDTVPYSAGVVTICYDLIKKIVLGAAQIYPNDKNSQGAVIIGSFMQAALHQTALAIFDMLHVPIWGRREDAADRLAAYIMVEFGEDLEEVGINGATTFFQWSAKTGKVWTGSDFADTASPDAQRYYNFLCIAVGADFPRFGGLVQKNVIPDKVRAQYCTGATNPDQNDPASIGRWNPSPGLAKEYQQVRTAFLLRIMPYVDPDALVKVRAMNFLGPMK
jgi:hypothetical protein